MTRLLETTLSPKVSIDKEAGVVRGAKFFGRESANNRTYSPAAEEDVRRLLESVVINQDHPDRKDGGRERGFMEGFAVPENITVRPDGLYGDVRCIKAHPVTPIFMEWAESHPDKLGFSINAEGKLGKAKGGKSVVESVHALHSLDLVRNPATTNGLFESKEKTVPKTFKQILEANFPKTAKGCSLLENTAFGAMEVEITDGADEVKAAFKHAADSILESAADAKAAAKQIANLVESFGKLSEETPPAKPAPAIHAAVAGIEPLQEEIRKLKSDAACRDLLESEGVKGSPLRLKVLSGLSDDERKEQIKEWKEVGDVARPRTASPLYESRDAGHKSTIPTDAKEFAKLAF